MPVPQRARVALIGPLPTEGAPASHDVNALHTKPGHVATHRPWTAVQLFRYRSLSVGRVTVRRIVAGNPQGDVDVTSSETGPSWVERLNPRHWTLVWKLVIVGLVPALLALTLGALRIADQAGSAADLGRGERLLELHTQVSAAGDALRQERDQATLYVAGNRTGDRGLLTTANAHSDDLLNTMRTGVQAAGTLDQSTTVAVAQANGVLGQLPSLRQDVTNNQQSTLPTIRDRYSRAIEGVDVLDRAVLRAVRVPDTAGQIDALTALQNVEAQLAVQHTVIGNAIRAGKLQDGDANAAGNADVQIFSQYRAYQVALTPDQLQRYGSFLDDPSNADRQRLAIAVLTSAGKPDLGGVTASDWDRAYNSAKAVADRSAGLIRQDLVATSNAAAQRASNLAGINSVVLMLGLLIGITIAVLVARSLVRSLRVLRSAALDVAERRLPQAVESMRAGEAPDVTVDPVPIRTRDEVGQVARAFDAVHGQAVRLAADQAALQANVSAMFVNLSRRSQALVERQLQLIEALESNEQDADQLSNLFQLDHLATRMRRNSENLLVLAGTDLAKRNMAPVPMVDVLRAAVSEVEQYQRVVVQAPPSASVAGRAGSDLVHLLAELLDNATNFSPPDSQVVMSATRTTDGAMVVEISDRGVGMVDHELSDANQRLGGPSSVDVSASRRMGLFVVGRLAARHGIIVHLSSSAAGPGTGLTASVTVPVSLIPTGVPAETSRPAGMPMAAGVPTQSRQSGDTRTQQRADVNGGRPTSLSALVAGTDGPAASASPGIRDSSAAGGQSTLSGGRPPVNGTTTNGLPTRKPGSSLRPDGPPPTDAPPGGFFDDGNGGSEGARGPAEQARLDQEAAARRDRLASAPSPRPERQTRPDADDERSTSNDERSPSAGDGPAAGTGPRLTKDPDPASGGSEDTAEDAQSTGSRSFTGPSGPTGGQKLTPFTGRPSSPPEQQGTGSHPLPGAGRPGPGPQTGEGRRPVPASGAASWAGGPPPAPRTDDSAAQSDQQAAPSGPSTAPDDDRAQPPAGGEALSAFDRGVEQTGPSAGGQFRSDQQRRAPQQPGPHQQGAHQQGADQSGSYPALPPYGGQPNGPRPWGFQPDAQPNGEPPQADGQAPNGQQTDGQQTGGYPYGSAAPGTQQYGTQQYGGQQYGGQQYGGQQSGPTAFGNPYPFAAQPGPQPNGSVSGTGGFPASPPRSGPVAMPPAPARPSSDDGNGRGLPPGPAPLPAMAPPPADRAADELFAPRVPSLDPEGDLPGHDPEASAFDLGETTPIFEEIASAWFRSNRPVPVSWESDTGPQPITPATPGPLDTDPTGVARQGEPAAAGPAGLEERPAVDEPVEERSTIGTPADSSSPVGRPNPDTADILGDVDTDTPPSAMPTPRVPAARHAPDLPFGEPVVPMPSEPEPEPADFASAADEGWLAASGAATERPDELTAAGLPKRRPRARLIPGSAGAAVLAPAVSAPRSAETIRGRLASYQQGVRQGRETRLRGFGSADTPATPAAADADHDEESS
jgi:signal transduction histidine kinase